MLSTVQKYSIYWFSSTIWIWKTDMTELMFSLPTSSLRRGHYDLHTWHWHRADNGNSMPFCIERAILNCNQKPIIIKAPSPSHGTTHNAEREKWDQPQALLFKKTSVTSPTQEEETRENVSVSALLLKIVLDRTEWGNHLNNCQCFLVWHSFHRHGFIVSEWHQWHNRL